MTVVRYKRAAAENPGKHGALDWKVTIDDLAPTHSETIFMLGMKLIAEDRYNAPWHRGRYLIWHYIDLLLTAKTPEEVVDIAEGCQAEVDAPKRSVA